ncbi:hypothetical protein Gotur_030906, partial [Gossypium turneri]
MSTSAVEVSGEKVKAMWDKRLTEIFYDICIKEIFKGKRPGTHFTKDGWLKIMTNFEKETGEDTGLEWDPIKRTVDASDDWWESRLQLDQMFMGIVATGDKAWAPSSGTLQSDFFEDVTNEIPEENEEENMRNDKSSKQIGGAVRLSSQIEKLCNAVDNMSQATSSLTPVMDPY